MGKKQKGFTLIELIIVLVLLGIVAAIAIPKYLDLTSQAKEKALKGNLSNIRGTISMQYSKSILDNAAAFPTLNATIFQGGIMPDDVYTPTSNVVPSTNDPIAAGDFTDVGGWVYNKTTGEVRVNLAGKHSW